MCEKVLLRISRSSTVIISHKIYEINLVRFSHQIVTVKIVVSIYKKKKTINIISHSSKFVNPHIDYLSTEHEDSIIILLFHQSKVVSAFYLFAPLFTFFSPPSLN